MFNEWILLIIGLIGLWFGAGIIIDNAKKFSEYLGISQSLIGLSVISIGTSLPEIATNILAGIDVTKGIPADGIAIGTNIGSCLAQITLIFGLTAIIGGKLKASKTILKRDGIMVLIAIILMFVVSLTGLKVLAVEGVILILLYFIYLYYISSREEIGKKIKKEFSKDFIHDGGRFRSVKIFVFIAIGITILIIASHMVVNNALALAEKMNWAASFVGVMIIGVGTGLPELTTAIRAIKEKASGISIGTLIGSNITDPMFSLGTGAIAAGSFGLIVDKELLYFDIPFWFFATIFTLLLFRKQKMLKQKHGFLLIGIFVIFAIIKFTYFI